MVTVVDYGLRKSSDGREFYVLIIQGGLSLVQSKQSGNYYATVKKCSIPSTFDEATAKTMLGERIPGSVQKKSCDEYQWTNKDSGEIITLDYRWVYVPENQTLADAIFEGEPQVELVAQKPKSLFVKV